MKKLRLIAVCLLLVFCASNLEGCSTLQSAGRAFNNTLKSTGKLIRQVLPIP